jgi:hypothetical protein
VVLLRFSYEKVLRQARRERIGLGSSLEQSRRDAKLTAMKRRRSERVLLQLRVMVTAEMEPARPVRFDAFTLVVNAHGGLLEMNMKARRGQKLMIANPAAGPAESATVVSVKGARDGSFAVAFEFDRPAPRFWPLSFHPSDWSLVEAEN